MTSPSEETRWQPSSDAQALAELRSLIRAYLRGELGHSAFVMQFGVQCLTHDLATPREPELFQRTEDQSDAWLLTSPDGKTTDLSLHKPSCGCDWCSAPSVGLYRGTPVDDSEAPVDE